VTGGTEELDFSEMSFGANPQGIPMAGRDGDLNVRVRET
jgi:hypothetical protein